MSPSPDHNIPSEKEIEALLERVKPHPTNRLRLEIASAPWNKHDYAQFRVTSSRKHLNTRLAWGLAFLVVIFVAGIVAFVPPVRAIARQIFYSFISAPSSQIDVQLTPVNPGELFNLNDPANFTLTVAQAQQQAGFPVQQITPTPAGLSLVGARYEASYHAVILFYQTSDYTLFLTQRPLGKGQDVFSIGLEARVEIVEVGKVQAEFVRGGWKIVSTQPALSTQPPGNPVNVKAIWDSSLPQSTLRWQADGTAFELRAVGEIGPSQSDLILWANELK